MGGAGFSGGLSPWLCSPRGLMWPSPCVLISSSYINLVLPLHTEALGLGLTCELGEIQLSPGGGCAVGSNVRVECTPAHLL